MVDCYKCNKLAKCKNYDFERVLACNIFEPIKKKKEDKPSVIFYGNPTQGTTGTTYRTVWDSISNENDRVNRYFTNWPTDTRPETDY